MLSLRRAAMFCSTTARSGKLPEPTPGLTFIADDLAADPLEEVPEKLPVESKPVRQRKRRNTMQRVYGTSYDHGMDDYK
jgi:hypothetical protein